MFRFVLWIALYHFEMLIAIERYVNIFLKFENYMFRVFALLFVATYEKLPRRYSVILISVILIIINYVFSAALGYLVVHSEFMILLADD